MLGENLRKIVKQLGGQDSFVRKTGIKKSTLNDYISGRTEPKASTLTIIASHSGKSIDWLLGSQGGSVGGDAEEQQSKYSIPQYDIQAAAGNGLLDMTSEVRSYVTFDSAWFERYAPNGAVLGAMEVNGDSMAPTLEPADMIIVNMKPDAIREALPEGGIFVLTVRGEFKVKRLQPMMSGDLRVISDNPRYEPEVVTADMVADSISIQGHVIWVGGPPKNV